MLILTRVDRKITLNNKIEEKHGNQSREDSSDSSAVELRVRKWLLFPQFSEDNLGDQVSWNYKKNIHSHEPPFKNEGPGMIEDYSHNCHSSESVYICSILSEWGVRKIWLHFFRLFLSCILNYGNVDLLVCRNARQALSTFALIYFSSKFNWIILHQC